MDMPALCVETFVENVEFINEDERQNRYLSSLILCSLDFSVRSPAAKQLITIPPNSAPCAVLDHAALVFIKHGIGHVEQVIQCGYHSAAP